LPAVSLDHDTGPFLAITDILVDFNSNIWKNKKDSGVSLKSEISDVEIPPELIDIQASLNVMHNIQL
jgi:hypothetical protein